MKAIFITLVLTGVVAALMLQRVLPSAQEDHDTINPPLQP